MDSTSHSYRALSALTSCSFEKLDPGKGITPSNSDFDTRIVWTPPVGPLRKLIIYTAGPGVIADSCSVNPIYLDSLWLVSPLPNTPSSSHVEGKKDVALNAMALCWVCSGVLVSSDNEHLTLPHVNMTISTIKTQTSSREPECDLVTPVLPKDPDEGKTNATPGGHLPGAQLLRLELDNPGSQSCILHSHECNQEPCIYTTHVFRVDERLECKNSVKVVQGSSGEQRYQEER
ncbi:hypothetical protein WG66_016522 [Moniliophthora roreri]|nr:hypothetical protein WG66_016522 [Moniliophthora roreri]